MNTICSFIPSCWEAGIAFSRTRHGERSSSWNRSHSARESLRSSTSLLRRYSRRPASEAIACGRSAAVAPWTTIAWRMPSAEKVGETMTYYAYPSTHWRQIRTNNPLERIIREIRRSSRVVGAFPDGHSALMLAAARLRHIPATNGGKRRYMLMDLLLNPAKQEPPAGQQVQASSTRILDTDKSVALP